MVQEGETVTRVGVLLEYSPAEMPESPVPLIDGFQWATIDLSDAAQKAELFDFLHNHYLSNVEGKWRYAYSEAFLEWALNPPGFVGEWLLGVRVASSGRLVAFNAAIPITLRVGDAVLSMYAMDFMCVHQKLRMKNLVPLIVEEIKRRGIRRGMSQAVWTSSRLLTEPLTSAGFSHRLINFEKLVAVGFQAVPPDAPMEQLIKRHAIRRGRPLPGFRPMEPRDVPEVTVKLNAHLTKFRVAQVFSELEAAHWFIPRPAVVASYVVEAPGGGIDGFFSVYIVGTTTIGVPQYPTMTIGYIFYYFAKPSLLTDLARATIQAVHWDYGIDVLNCLEIQDNAELRESLGFRKGTGEIHYYLFNYALPPIRPHEIALVFT
jgi:glycylpeptide N-tetradecanoyltransferase